MIGSGEVGETLANGFLALGFEVMRGSRDAAKLASWKNGVKGAAPAARAIEPLAILWCIPGFLRNEWTHAFKLLK